MTIATGTNDIIFGKDKTEKVVSVHVDNSVVTLYTERDGVIGTEVRENKYWTVHHYPSEDCRKLKGLNAHYKYITEYEDRELFLQDRQFLRKKDCWYIYDEQEQHLVKNGITYYKDMKLQDVSVLSFDIEAVGLTRDNESKVLLISNTFRKNGEITRIYFSYDDFDSDAEMIHAWTEWVREVNPSIICGHNIFGYDLPYMQHCYERQYHQGMPLGRDGSGIYFNSYTSEFRKDGSQKYDYTNAKIVGREIVDTFFLSFKYDIGRKYVSNGLKQIIKQEGLEKVNRVHYDASKIKENYKNPEEWKKIIEYAMDDSDDSLALFDLMIPATFYFCQHIPKTLQQIVNSATGSQLNAFMVRAYLQNGEGLPKATDTKEYIEGGISFAVPGIYKNLLKVDLKSAYPSQVLRFKLYDEKKDPHGYFYEMVKYFTNERFALKDQFKKTGNKYYSDREQTSKVFINSAYGLCNTPGLLFNSPKIAAKITRETRAVLNDALVWASGKGADHWMHLFQERTGQLDDVV